ncbi:MAG: hypothetical protein ACLSDQ_08760 [Adlercreutzia equolifaciens]
MLIETLSTFPHMYDSVMGESMMKRAQEKGILEFRAHDLRDWTHDRHRTTDDDPYGGGAGLVMKCDPIFEAVEAILGKEFVEANLLQLRPGGVATSSSAALRSSSSLLRAAPSTTPMPIARRRRPPAVHLGHYEGIDERVYTLADHVISLGLRAHLRRAGLWWSSMPRCKLPGVWGGRRPRGQVLHQRPSEYP